MFEALHSLSFLRDAFRSFNEFFRRALVFGEQRVRFAQRDALLAISTQRRVYSPPIFIFFTSRVAIGLFVVISVVILILDDNGTTGID